MIKKLKRKFIILSTVLMLVLMAILVGIMNIINYTSVVSETDSILQVLSQQKFPFDNQKEMLRRLPLPRGMSPEVPFEARYFIALVSNNGSVEESDISSIISVDKESVESYVKQAFESNNDRGFIGQFRFVKQSDGIITRIIFLDCGRKLDAFRYFMWTSIAVGLLGCLIVFVVFLFVAGRIVRPIAESYEKQKRFITDAGHEIKTPLTIINANLDLLEYDYGENESFSDMRTQTKLLTELTNNLVYLSKMEEAGKAFKKIDFPVSDLIQETAQQFRSLAQTRNRDFRIQVEPNVTLNGVPDEIRQLVNILLDNAMKYSMDGGIVLLDMQVHKKTLVLSVCNSFTSPIPKEDLSRLFDRFYRADSSRNSETGGHGIGLSIAKAITVAHGGKITASTNDENEFTVNVSLPLNFLKNSK